MKFPSKSWITGAAMAVVGFLQALGVEMPVDLITQAIDQISAALEVVFANASGVYTAVLGALVIWFRNLAQGPLVKGVKGLLLGQKE